MRRLSARLGDGTSSAGYDTSRVGPVNADCARQTYQLQISSNNIVFEHVDSNSNEMILTSLLQTFLPSPSNFSAMYESPTMQQVSNTYSLSGTLCVPKAGAKNDAHVQFLVHGVGFDSSYWDFAVDGSDEYSYVSAAAAAGYTTFRYDRLGTGLSEKPVDAYNVVQGPTDLSIATKFASMLRSGEIGGKTFTKIVGVGHSYGSAQLQALTATAPSAIDGVLLQGFSINSTGQSTFLAGGAYSTATQVFPNRWPSGELVNAYLTTLAPQTQQLLFWYFPYFSDAAFKRNRETEQPVTQGVLFSQGGLVQPAPHFTGPVHVVTGAQDFPFCFRDCYAVPEGSPRANIPEYVQDLYPSASSFSTYIPANTGHGVNAHYSAPAVYQEMLQFVATVL